jgi:hypothetical protein
MHLASKFVEDYTTIQKIVNKSWLWIKQIISILDYFHIIFILQGS